MTKRLDEQMKKKVDHEDEIIAKAIAEQEEKRLVSFSHMEGALAKEYLWVA